MRDRSDRKRDRGVGEVGGRHDLLPCINAEHRVEVTVQWWRSLRLG